MNWDNLPSLHEMEAQKLLPLHLIREANELIEEVQRKGGSRPMSPALYNALSRLCLLASLDPQRSMRH